MFNNLNLEVNTPSQEVLLHDYWPEAGKFINYLAMRPKCSWQSDEMYILRGILDFLNSNTKTRQK